MILFDRLKRRYPTGASQPQSIVERSIRRKSADGSIEYYNEEMEMGARQEAISSFLDNVSASLIQLQSLEAELRSKKNDLYAEFSEHSRERAEFTSLAKAYAQTRQQLAQQLEHGNELQFELSAVQRELDQVRGEFHYAEAESQQRQAEILRQGKEARRIGDELAEALVIAERTNQRVSWLDSDNGALRRQIAEFEEKYKAHDIRLQELGQVLALSEADCGALRKYADAQASEVNRLARTSSDLEEALAERQKKMQLLEAQLSNEQSELRRVSQASESIALAARSQVEAAEMRAETATSRASRLENENTRLLQQVQEANAADRGMQRDLVDARVNAERQEERLRLLEADLVQSRAEAQAAGNARSVAVERSDQLLATLDKRNGEIQLFTDRTAELQEKIAKLEADHAAERGRSVEDVRQLTEANERLRSEYAVAQGALEGARQDRARLADQVQKFVLQQSNQNSLPPELLDLFGKEPTETPSNIRTAGSGRARRQATSDLI